jgi:hypothetical protein
MRPCRRTSHAAVVAVLTAALMGGAGVAYAAFSSAATGSLTHSTAATFPTHPQTVGALTPAFYHRMDDPVWSTSVADSSGNSRPGTYPVTSGGPALHWAFDETDGSQSTADVSGNANPGSFTPTAGREAATSTSAPTSGQVGVFDGSRHLTSARTAVTTTKPFTVSAWVRLTDSSATRTVVSQFGTAGNRFALRHEPATGWQFAMTSADGGGGTAVYAAATLHTWTHLVGVWDGTSMHLQVNKGARVTAGMTGSWDATGLLSVGARETTAGHVDHWMGQIDRVRVYPFALSQANADWLVDNPNSVAPFGFGAPGVLPGSTAVAFGGGTNAYNNTYWAGPQTFSYTFWLRSTTTRGGYLVGFGSHATGASSMYDRIVHLTPDGRVSFGVYDDTAVQTIETADAYHDGQWHHVAATFTSGSMRLYVDGELRAERTDVLNAQTFDGYFRLGYDKLEGWTSAPAADWPYVGGLDEFAVFGSVLSAQDVAHLYWANFSSSSSPCCTTQ